MQVSSLLCITVLKLINCIEVLKFIDSLSMYIDEPIGYSRRRTSRPSTDHHMVGACDINGSQSRYSMEHIHHESNYFILLQHKSIYLDGEPHVVLTLLCRAQLHVEQIMLLHSLVAHSRRQSIMFHAGESYDGTALKSTVHCRPMERCRQFDDG